MVARAIQFFNCFIIRHVDKLSMQFKPLSRALNIVYCKFMNECVFVSQSVLLQKAFNLCEYRSITLDNVRFDDAFCNEWKHKFSRYLQNSRNVYVRY